MNKKVLKVIGMVALMLMMCGIMALAVSADVESGLNDAKEELLESGMNILSNVFVPIGEFICLAVLVYLIITAIGKHRENEGYKSQLVGIGVTVAVMILLLAFGIWGPEMIA